MNYFISLDSNSVTYLLYHHRIDLSFRVYTVVSSGSCQIRAISINESETVENVIKTIAFADFPYGDSYQYDTLLI